MSTLTASHQPLRTPRVHQGPGRVVPSRALVVRWDRVAALLLGLVVVTWLLVGAMAGASDADTPVPDPVSVVIQPGDTVWDLARQHAPAGVSTLEYVMQVELHNDVRSGGLLPGTVLELPQG